jgi:hypothetical protein
MEVSGQLHAPAALDTGLNGPQSRSGSGGEEKKLALLAPPGIEPRSFIHGQKIKNTIYTLSHTSLPFLIENKSTAYKMDHIEHMLA